MTYDDQAYMKASADLADAIYVLVENEITDEDIREMFETALQEGRDDE